MSSEWDETCLVCCEKTKNRCSKCAEAGIDLFFCSPKCQKLVWNVHKRVCGPGKANPFVWPLLSKDEAREVIEHMHESTGLLTRYSPDRNTVAKAMQKDSGLPLERLRMCIDGVTEGRPPSSAANFVRQQLLVVTIRALEHARLANLITSAESLIVFRSRKLPSSWGSASDWDVNIARDESTSWEAHGTEPWRAKARHYVLMLRVVLLDACIDSSGDVSGSLDAHRARLADYVRTTVAASSPRLAAELLFTMDRHEHILQACHEVQQGL